MCLQELGLILANFGCEGCTEGKKATDDGS
jgi:hypothetical protein